MTADRRLHLTLIGRDKSVEDTDELAPVPPPYRYEQTCPDCGRWEAAGSYCSWCLRPMSRDDWYRNGDVERRELVRLTVEPEGFCPEMRRPGGRGKGDTENRTTPPKRPRGRPRSSDKHLITFGPGASLLRFSTGSREPLVGVMESRPDDEPGVERPGGEECAS